MNVSKDYAKSSVCSCVFSLIKSLVDFFAFRRTVENPRVNVCF